MLLERISRLPLADVRSLLLAIYQGIAESITPAYVLNQFCNDRFSKPSDVDQRLFNRFNTIAFEQLPDKYDAIELSPVAPIASNSVLTRVCQRNVMSTNRLVDVVADPAIALALHCAKRRRILILRDTKHSEIVRAATSHRVLRTQDFRDIAGFTSHFRAFALASAGRDTGSEQFEKQMLTEHIHYYLMLLDQLVTDGIVVADRIKVNISDIRITEMIIDHFGVDRLLIGRNSQNPPFALDDQTPLRIPNGIADARDIPDDFIERMGSRTYVTSLGRVSDGIFPLLRTLHPNVSFSLDLARKAGIGYYASFCFKISAQNAEGVIFPIADGGMSDWTQQLVASRKERLLTSGIGTELLLSQFNRTPTASQGNKIGD